MEILTGVALLVLAVTLPAALIVAAGKLAKATASRPVPAPQIISAPAPVAAASAAPEKAKGIRVRWDEEEVEFEPEEAANIITELITDVFKELNSQDKMLLHNIYRSHQAGNRHRLSEDFRRGSPEHQYYRRLRDAHLIRPIEGKFIPGARIAMTDFGLAVIQRFPNLLAPDDTSLNLQAVGAAEG